MTHNDSSLAALLKEHFGFEQFRPLQKEIIRSVLEGKETFALLPTGGGKSLCYQLPALTDEGLYRTMVFQSVICGSQETVTVFASSAVVTCSTPVGSDAGASGSRNSGTLARFQDEPPLKLLSLWTIVVFRNRFQLQTLKLPIVSIFLHWHRHCIDDCAWITDVRSRGGFSLIVGQVQARW